MSQYSNLDSKKQYTQSFTNYTSRDFNSIKQSLIQHIKSYFPQVYKDFNESSPGMMLVELSAYVGDVLNYYIDDSFKELMLPLSNDRRNVINLAKLSGFKPRPITPSFVDLKFTLEVDATNVSTNPIPDSSQLLTIDAGTIVASNTQPDIVFETLEPIDFRVDKKLEEKFVVSTLDDSTGLVSTMKGERKVKAVSGQTKTITFNVNEPEQFRKLTIPDTDVIEILSCVDTQGNNWYEVDYLAQENVAIESYTGGGSDSSQTNADGETSIVPSSLKFLKTTKRFIRETNEDNTTSLVFGNGVIRNGNSFNTTYLQLEQEGVNLPTTNFSPPPLDVTMGGFYESLGESPQNTALTITYRAGGGLDSNLAAENLTVINSATTIPAGGSTTNLTVTNDLPAVGGKEGDATEEIRYNALANYSTQNRCVTKEDFEARTISMPGRFGSIAKVFCTQGGAKQEFLQINELQDLKSMLSTLLDKFNDLDNITDLNAINLNDATLLNYFDGPQQPPSSEQTSKFLNTIDNVINSYETDNTTYNPTTDIYVLSYNTDGKLITSPGLVKQNLQSYLNQFRMLTDKIRILDGFVINFGVFFNVMAFPGFNKTVIKNNCINAIRDFYDVKNMNFKEVLYTADVVSILNSIEGVKAVNDVVFTQKENFLDSEESFTDPLYSKSFNNFGEIINLNSLGYGFLYDFNQFFTDDAVSGRGVVLPSVDPSVFEIKNPQTDIRGVVK